MQARGGGVVTFRSSHDDGEKGILCSAFPITCRVIYGAHARNLVTPPFNIESAKAEAHTALRGAFPVIRCLRTVHNVSSRLQISYLERTQPRARLMQSHGSSLELASRI
jgi:hypothetical protein